VGIIDKHVVYTPFAKAVKHTTQPNKVLLEMVKILSE